jgi:hypothetical protein
MGHVYSVTAPGAPAVLVMAKAKAEARNYVANNIAVERLTSEEVVAAMRAGTDIGNANSPKVDPNQTEFENLNVTP